MVYVGLSQINYSINVFMVINEQCNIVVDVFKILFGEQWISVVWRNKILYIKR